MKKEENLTEIAIILDESGSMNSVKEDTIGGFNEFLDKQKNVEGKANLTLIKFNTKYEVVYLCDDIQSIPKLNEDNYSPGDMTALLDAVGKGIYEISNNIQKRKKEEKPDKLLFVIMTDGYENSSGEYSYDQIKKIIKEKEDKDNWEFLFIGADLENFNDADNLGLTLQTSSDKGNMAATYNSLSDYTAMYRTTNMSAQARMDTAFSEEDDEDENSNKS